MIADDASTLSGLPLTGHEPCSIHGGFGIYHRLVLVLPLQAGASPLGSALQSQGAAQWAPSSAAQQA